MLFRILGTRPVKFIVAGPLAQIAAACVAPVRAGTAVTLSKTTTVTGFTHEGVKTVFEIPFIFKICPSLASVRLALTKVAAPELFDTTPAIGVCGTLLIT